MGFQTVSPIERITDAPLWPERLAGMLVRPASPADIEAVLALHSEAFADKFGGAFGTGSNGTRRGTAALMEAWQRQGRRALRGMVLAEWQQQIIGTTTLRTWEMGDDDGGITEMAFQQVLGVWGATRSIIALSLLSHRIERPEGFITDVAVHADFRRCGVARCLLEQAERRARLLNKRYLSLYVSDTNTNAIRLYESMGFARRRVRHSLLTWFFFRQHKWLYMQKSLDE